MGTGVGVFVMFVKGRSSSCGDGYVLSVLIISSLVDSRLAIMKELDLVEILILKSGLFCLN